MSKARTVSVGVDVDALKYYFQIHGLNPDEATDAAWSLGVPRFLDLFRESNCAATFYCVASDLVEELPRQLVKEMVAQGHEVGNHTYDHHYGLTELSPAEIYEQISRARVRLEDVSGSSVVGFRAPGYHLNGTVIRAARASGHRYDTSVFPCVPYYLAKAGIMGLMRLRGRSSQSLLGRPGALIAPRSPYLASLDNPYRRTDARGLEEFPISVMAGVPLIGTAFTALGTLPSLGVVSAALRRYRHLTLEFHAADLLSIDEDGLPPQLSVQPDLRVSWAQKFEVFAAVLGRLAAGAEVRRLDHMVGDVR